MTTLTISKYEDVRIPVPWGYISGRWYGNRQVRPILAIHGWLDNLGTFNTLIPLLSAHVGILCIDLPGHGRSSHHPLGIRYHVSDFIPIISYVMKEYNWQRVSLMGHSLGGALGYLYASILPHKVDMIIAIDIVKPPYKPPRDLKLLAQSIEKTLVEDDRIEEQKIMEPPSHTYEQLKQILYEGSLNSVEIENTKHLLERSITKSKLYPEKYYFSRDGRLKYYQYLLTDAPLSAAMARRIKNIPYLIIKGSLSPFIDEESKEIIDILGDTNKHFEYYEIYGTHHPHLNNPEACAKVIVPFINRYRPAAVDSWALHENGGTPDAKRKTQERFFTWNRRRNIKNKPKSKL